MSRHRIWMNMNTAEERLGWIFGRRSIRVYSPAEVSEESVQKMLEAAMAAPSAMAKDPWRFVVIRNRQTLQTMAAAFPGGEMLASAGLGIVVCGDLEVTFERQISFMLQDCSAAIENLLLGAHTMGLGACWVGVHPMEDRIKRLKEMLALPKPVIPVACVAVGHPGEVLAARTRFKQEYVHLERW